MDATALAAELARPGLPGVVAPAWDGRSLGSILPTVLRALGAPLRTGLLPPLRDLPPGLLDGVERVVLLTLDGWGWGQLAEHLRAEPRGGWARLAARGALLPLTSAAPATTTACLATLSTGVAPAEHGLLGYHLWLQEFGCVANMVRFAPAVGGRSLDAHVRPEDFFATPTAAELLARGGARHVNITRREFLGSALTRMLYQGGLQVGTTTLGELLVEARRAVAALGGERGLVQAYWPSIDTVAHARGPGSDHHAAEMALVGDAVARELLGKLRDKGTLLLATADHGLVHVPPQGMLRVRDHPDLVDLLHIPPWGDSRWAFLQSRDGRRDELRERLLERLGPGATVLPLEEVERHGLLGPGPLSAAARRRAGDLVALAPPGRGLTWPFQWEDPSRPPKEELLGRHGGATAEEMLVPLLAVRC